MALLSSTLAMPTATQPPAAHTCNLHLASQVEGAGFLYRQVRHMVGALIAVGCGRLQEAAIAEALAVGARQLPGQGGLYRGWNVAPAVGD